MVSSSCCKTMLTKEFTYTTLKIAKNNNVQIYINASQKHSFRQSKTISSKARALMHYIEEKRCVKKCRKCIKSQLLHIFHSHPLPLLHPKVMITSTTMILIHDNCCISEQLTSITMLFSIHMDLPHQWHTAEPTRSGQWTKVQLLCKHIYYIRLQRLSNSQIINA